MTSSHQISAGMVSDLSWCATHEPNVPLERLNHFLACGNILVGRSGDERVGYLRFEWLWGKKPFLASIQVAADQRRSGLGTRLLTALEDRLRADGHSFLLSSTMPDNLISQQWHRRQGFEECGFLAGINREGVGEIFYRKELARND